MMAGEIGIVWKTSHDLFSKAKITCSKDIVEYLEQIYDKDLLDIKETAYAIYLNRNNIVKAWTKLSEGSISATVMDPKDIFGTGLKCKACAIIIAHNHPSGSCRPSDSDVKLTKQLSECGKFMEMQLFDHVIYTPEGSYSFADSGEL